MVIQCPSCTTKYRLNLESLPNRKTFVKCRNCGTPIYIDPPADAAAEASAPYPVPAPAAAPASHSEVACPQCGTRYRVPTEALGRAGVRLKCTHCNNVFSPPAPRAAASAPAPQAAVPLASSASSAPPAPQRDFFPSAAGEPDDSEPMHRPMPIPDDQELDGMFDDLRDRSTPFGAEPIPSHPKSQPPAAEPPKAAAPKPAPPMPAVDPAARPPAMRGQPMLNEQTEESTEALMAADLDRLGDVPPPPPRRKRPAASAFNPEQAYLEAVSIDDDLPLKPPSPRGTVPDEQKYRIFLKPGSFAEDAPAAEPPAPAPKTPPWAPVKPPPIPPPRAAAAMDPFQELEDQIAPPPRVIDQPMAAAMDELLGTDVVDASMESMNLDALAGQLERESPLDDVDALLKDEGLDTTPLPELPRLAPRPMSHSGAPSDAATARMEALRNQTVTAGLVVLAAGVLVLLFWLGFKLA